VTGDKLLQYIGLRQPPGTKRTTVDRIFTWAIMVVMIVSLILTRNLDFWLQFAVMLTIAVVFGLVFGAALIGIDATRRRTAHE
jgi:Sec-independent protein secretion pathway component TatC